MRSLPYERDVLAARVRGYQPRQLDELCAGGEVVWVGRGSLGSEDGRVALFRRERLSLLAPSTPEEARTEILERAEAGEKVFGAEVKETIAG